MLFKDEEVRHGFRGYALIAFFLPPSPPFQGLSGVRKDGGGWAFGEAGETIPEMSRYSHQSGCFV